ncbi:MAG: hypothetical protein CMJ84_01745 [Planctomycetes bacterium]|jgi:hypothetical protein|nr:hypothetical protein [Planctomycetota bacterium]MDP6408648.1 DUF1570 domain-containing protein [Planctomycetota bacterium]
MLPTLVRAGALLCALLALPPEAGAYAAEPDAADGVHERAETFLEGKDYEAAAKLLREHLMRTGDDARARELIGRALLHLDRPDEAAHHLAVAVSLIEAGGDTRGARNARRDLGRADGLSSRRDRIFRDITSKLLKAAESLHENGHAQRALDLLGRIAPVAAGKEAKKVDSLHQKVRAAFQEIDLDSASVERTEAGAWPLIELESAHYKLRCNLEREVVQLVADTMDDIHAYYVSLYLDGDESAISGARATIRIHPDREKMLEHWGGGGEGPAGWWSPGENKVTCYDTRTNGGSLDQMLLTLYHEASHQFMTALSRKGGWAPAWLNEGTSTFFEGAVAMADHRVLWPDAAIGRLRNLTSMLEHDSGPSLTEVIGYSGRGSYPGEYYAFGWGLVYFMQQYEDPATLEYVYRPLYARYRERITSRGGNSMELFGGVFLSADSPLDHETFADFERDWRRWILEEVKPMHIGPAAKRRERRAAAAGRYLEAAAAAGGGRKTTAVEREFLARALGHIEYVRTKIDKEDGPDLGLLIQQIEVLTRLDRPEACAPLIEQVLDGCDDGSFELDEEPYADFEKRLRTLDRRNWALRNARSRIAGLTRAARRLAEDYLEADPPLLLRAYTFAAEAGTALGDGEELLPLAAQLRGRAREAGLLLGEVRSLAARKADWTTTFSAPAKRFDPSSPSGIRIASVRPSAYVNTVLAVGVEYELRARLRRVGEVFMSSVHGLVVHASADGDWIVFGIGREGRAGLWHITPTEGGGALSRSMQKLFLERPVEPDEHPRVVAHVAGRQLTVVVEGRQALEIELPEDLAPARHAGVFVKDGECLFEDAVIELYP